MEQDNVSLEKQLLSILINKRSLYYDNCDILSASIFDDPVYKALYLHLDAEYQQGNTFDYIKAAEHLKHIDDIAYVIASVISTDSYFTSIDKIISTLSNNAKKKTLYECCTKYINDAYKDITTQPIDDLIKSVNSLDSTTYTGIKDMVDHIKSAVQEIEVSCSTKGITGIPTGFQNLDEFTGGWKKQDLVIVGGASSMGKTSLALAFAYNAAVSGIPTAIFSYEMSTNQMVKRLISSSAEISNKKLMEGNISDNEWSLIHKNMANLEKLPLYIDECSKTSLRYLLNRIRQYVITKKVKLVMIDYLQLVSNHAKGRNREQEVSVIARSLKNIAKELDISVIALSQLSRGVEKRQGCRPTLGDLRESGEIEQAADVVTLVYRPEYYGFEEDEKGQSVKGLAEIIFAKGRNIGVGSRFLHFIDFLTKFKEIEQDVGFY